MKDDDVATGRKLHQTAAVIGHTKNKNLHVKPSLHCPGSLEPGFIGTWDSLITIIFRPCSWTLRFLTFTDILTPDVASIKYWTCQVSYDHDDVIKWKHFRDTGPLWGESIGHRLLPHKGQWRGALMFSLICAWTKRFLNNRDAGDLRRNRAHYDVTVIIAWLLDLTCMHITFNQTLASTNSEHVCSKVCLKNRKVHILRR